MLYICAKFCEISSNGIKLIERTDFYTENYKGNNSAENVGGVTVLNLCTLSGHALYFCQVSRNYLERYQSYRTITGKFHQNPLKTVGGVAETRLCLRTDGLTDGRTQNYSSLRLTSGTKIAKGP